MNNQSEIYFNMQCPLFPLLEEEIGEITEKLYLSLADCGVLLATVLTSASPHDSPVSQVYRMRQILTEQNVHNVKEILKDTVPNSIISEASFSNLEVENFKNWN
jgi:hypothetical protein